MMDFISVQIFEEDDIMTPMNNADYLIRLQHADELDAMKAAKKASGLTYEALAEKIGVNKVWLASAFEGQQYVPEEYCDQPRHFSQSTHIKATRILFSTDFMRSLIHMALPSRT